MNELDNYPQSRITRRCGQLRIPFAMVVDSPYFWARPEKRPKSKVQYRDGLNNAVGWGQNKKPIAAKDTLPFSYEELMGFLGLNVE